MPCGPSTAVGACRSQTRHRTISWRASSRTCAATTHPSAASERTSPSPSDTPDTSQCALFFQ
uniref:Uncharacterized protein n=1 Tax=Anguilla anguilla TaxID=7936 RepID=A0A0E9WZJ8_ANGAN